MRNRIVSSVVVVIALFAVGSFLAAQSGKQPDAGKATSASPAAAKGSSLPDLSGVWSPRDFPGTYTKEEPPMTPWAIDKFKANTSRPKMDLDPDVKCFPPGPTRIYLHHYPFEIVNAPGRVIIHFEYDSIVRQIYTDGRGHPSEDDLTSPWMGHSIGRWDGDTLVVDTVGMNDRTWLDEVGHPHSAALHFVERLRRADQNTLEATFTFDDPKAFTHPWTAQKIFKLKPGWDIAEQVCADNFEWTSEGRK